MKPQQIWELCPSSKGYLTLIPDDLDYFQTHFIGKPMCHNWQTPPVEIYGKSLKLGDFIGWMLTAPVISEKAKRILEPFISPYVEFLPFIELRGKQFFALNVIELVDCLDKKKSTIRYAPDDPTYILSIGNFFFDAQRVKNVPIFKVAEYPKSVFVTHQFVELIVKNKLRGAAFADPSIEPFGRIMSGDPLNTVDGVT